MNRYALLTMLAAALVAPPLPAADAPRATLALERAWARATPPGASVGAVYLIIDNRSSRSDRLLSVASPRAARVEVHATVRDVDVVRMRRVDPLHIGAAERLVLEPGGTHVMLMGLKAPLVEGETVPLTFRFELAGAIDVAARVHAVGDDAAAADHSHH